MCPHLMPSVFAPPLLEHGGPCMAHGCVRLLCWRLFLGSHEAPCGGSWGGRTQARLPCLLNPQLACKADHT